MRSPRSPHRLALVAGLVISLAFTPTILASPRVAAASGWEAWWTCLADLASPFLAFAEGGDHPATKEGAHIVPAGVKSPGQNCGASDCTYEGWGIDPYGLASDPSQCGAVDCSDAGWEIFPDG